MLYYVISFVNTQFSHHLHERKMHIGFASQLGYRYKDGRTMSQLHC